MAVSNPDWLKLHGGDLRASKDGKSFTVYLNGEPQYLILPVPAAGKFGTRVSQTNNGKRLDNATTYPSLDAAVQGGLDDLRKALGW